MVETLNTTKIAIHLADGKMVKGLLNIRKYNRVSDFLNSKDSDQFLTVYDAVMDGVEDKFIIINRDHVIWIIPEE